ncbi:MAG: glycosyltransferase [Atribacterota bacterium]
MINLDKKPLIGFFPGFFDMGETYPLIKIARCYQELGVEVVIFSHGGDYEYLAKQQGFKIKRVKPLARGPDITRYFMKHSDEEIIKMIRNEALVYRTNGIKALVQTSSYLDCLLAPLVAKIPLISVINGTLAPPYNQANYATYPDISENFFTQLVPQYIKNRINNWYTLNYKGPITKKFNRIAKKINIGTRFTCFQDLILGDYTLLCDDMDFLALKPTKDFPAENYIGPILPNDLFEQKEKDIDEIEKHLKKPGKSILLTMGSSFVMKTIFLKILKILNQTDYNVIATYTNILNEDEHPKLNDNILLKKFISFTTELNKKVDLAIIHGGRGTVYTAAYLGKPAIGIPLNGEQQYNLDNLVRHGTAIRLSKTFFTEEKLLNAIKNISDHYDTYLKNAQALTQKMPRPEGDKNAAHRIMDFIAQPGNNV